MHFLSLEWLGWLAATLSLYWLAPRSWRDEVLIGLTLTFLLVYSPISAAVLAALTAIVYYLCQVESSALPAWRAWLAAGCVIGALIAFKLGARATEANFVRDVAVPLGLAYYAIRFLHYIIDCYKGIIPRHGFRDFIAYQFFLPTIVVGPIHRFHAFSHDLHYKRWDARALSEGAQRILYGYAKIAILGNYVISGVFANYVGALSESYNALSLYLEIVRQGLNLYFQFSGFSDIAIGFSLMLGYRVMENFNWPYMQRNISDFWRSWHMSLTSFAREHVFTVVFANTRRRFIGVIATLVFIGLWHEISLRYLAWGVYHGLGIVIWQAFHSFCEEHGREFTSKPVGAILHVASVLFTVHFVWFSFVIVRQPDLWSALQVYETILLSWWL